LVETKFVSRRNTWQPSTKWRTRCFSVGVLQPRSVINPESDTSEQPDSLTSNVTLHMCTRIFFESEKWQSFLKYINRTYRTLKSGSPPMGPTETHPPFFRLSQVKGRVESTQQKNTFVIVMVQTDSCLVSNFLYNIYTTWEFNGTKEQVINVRITLMFCSQTINSSRKKCNMLPF